MKIYKQGQDNESRTICCRKSIVDSQDKQTFTLHYRNLSNRIYQLLTKRKNGIYYRGELQKDNSYKWVETTRLTRQQGRDIDKGGSQAFPQDNKLQALYLISDEIRNIAQERDKLTPTYPKWYLGPHISICVVAKKMFIAINTGTVGKGDCIIPTDEILKSFAINAIEKIVLNNNFHNIKKNSVDYFGLDTNKKALYWAVNGAKDSTDNIITFGYKYEKDPEDAIHGEQRIMNHLSQNPSILEKRKQVILNAEEERVVHIGGTKGDCADCEHTHYEGLKNELGAPIRASNEHKIGSAILSPQVPEAPAWHFRDWYLPQDSSSDHIYNTHRPEKQLEPRGPQASESYIIKQNKLIQRQINPITEIERYGEAIANCNNSTDTLFFLTHN